MLCGGCAVLQESGMTGRLLQQLTVALLVKLPTFNYDLPLFIVVNNF